MCVCGFSWHKIGPTHTLIIAKFSLQKYRLTLVSSAIVANEQRRIPIETSKIA